MTNQQKMGAARRFWMPLIEDFEALKGVTQRQFCDQHNLKIDSFKSWLYKIRRERNEQAVVHSRTKSRPPSERAEARFVAVEIPSQPLVLVNAGEVKVEFGILPPPAWIAELAACLGGD